MSQGFILTAMILSAMLAHIIDRQFLKAGYWAVAGAALSALGIIHAYRLSPEGVQNVFGWLAAPQFVAGYALTACVLFALHRRHAHDVARIGEDTPAPR